MVPAVYHQSVVTNLTFFSKVEISKNIIKRGTSPVVIKAKQQYFIDSYRPIPYARFNFRRRAQTL